MTLWPLAFIAGVISFSSPCCLPLLPGYLAHISGLVTPGSAGALRSRTVAGAALFVLGFTLIFALLGASAGLLGGFLLDQRELLLRAAGFVIIAMALLQITGWRPALFAQTALVPVQSAPGIAGSFPLGMAFAASWTPCVGPVLAAVLVTASAEASAAEGAGLLTVYALGLGVPFVLSAFALERFSGLRRAVLGAHRQIEILGGLVLGLMGVLILTDRWLPLMGPVLRWYAQLGWPPF